MRRLIELYRCYPVYGRVGFLLLVAGEGLIVARARPASDFYFPFVWLGYILVLDAGLLLTSGRSLLAHRTGLFLALFPISALFWWIFELFNQAVHNWIYIGAAAYQGPAYVGIASLDFSFVLPAVITTAMVLASLIPGRSPVRPRGRVSRPVLFGVLLLGLLALALPIAAPGYFFGLIWLCLFFVLDPLNYTVGRPSLLEAAARRDWRLPLSLALAALVCGFFWEAWNFWAMPKWVYDIPHVNKWHIFEMPLLGWSGYLPFGLELFAMANFILPLLGLGELTLDLEPGDQTPQGAASSPKKASQHERARSLEL